MRREILQLLNEEGPAFDVFIGRKRGAKNEMLKMKEKEKEEVRPQEGKDHSGVAGTGVQGTMRRSRAGLELENSLPSEVRRNEKGIRCGNRADRKKQR